MDDSVGSVAAATTSNGRNTEAGAVPPTACALESSFCCDPSGRRRPRACPRRCERDELNEAVLSSASWSYQHRWTRTAVAPAPQPGLRKLRFDRWCIWGLSSQMRGVAVPGWAHWLTLAHCLGSSPPHHTWVLRHIGNGVISSRSVGLLDVRFSISTRSLIAAVDLPGAALQQRNVPCPASWNTGTASRSTPD